MTEFGDLIVRTLPIIFGGGIVQIVILFIKRRAEIRAADVAARKGDIETDAVVVASAEKSLLLADQMRDRAVKQAELFRADLAHAEAALADLHVEVRSLRIEVATAHREIAHLTAKLAAQAGTGAPA